MTLNQYVVVTFGRPCTLVCGGHCVMLSVLAQWVVDRGCAL
jgi:hypothetical protein